MNAPTPPARGGRPPTADYVSNNRATAEWRSDTIDRFIVLGYITAVAMPPIGLILGILLAVRLPRPHSRHAAWIIVLGILAAITWILLLTSGVVNTTNSDTT